jgi:EAL domain-containing protein (putative c-di-GMP-specific phosphodiesterase class I)/GGDEF domain-containing protein
VNFFETDNVPIDWHQFSERLEDEVARAGMSGQRLALVGVQLKKYYLQHAIHGARASEILVAQAIAALEQFFNLQVIIHRIAPDTLAVIVTDVPVPELLLITAKNIVTKLASEEDGVPIDASVVIALYPDHGQDAASLSSEMHFSLSRNERKSISYSVLDKPLTPKFVGQRETRERLEAAIANHEMVLYYQPKIDLQSLKPVSCEALLRWQQEDGTIVGPMEFISITEATGEIHRLSELIIHTAMREIAELPYAGSVAVNVSASSIYDPAFVSSLQSALAIWGLPPESFILELTESVLMSDPQLSFSQLSEIRELGIKISIDDFGTGFSSLAYFKSIPADELKIDQSFVIGMKNSQDDEKIVSLIIELAHRFGMRVVAEGIESRSVLAQLRDMGCDIGQGFYLAKPMNLSDYRQWLRRFHERSS